MHTHPSNAANDPQHAPQHIANTPHHTANTPQLTANTPQHAANTSTINVCACICVCRYVYVGETYVDHHLPLQPIRLQHRSRLQPRLRLRLRLQRLRFRLWCGGDMLRVGRCVAGSYCQILYISNEIIIKMCMHTIMYSITCIGTITTIRCSCHPGSDTLR